MTRRTTKGECDTLRICDFSTEFETVAPLPQPFPVNNRECAPLTTCLATQYRSTDSTDTTDRVCTDLTTCTAAQYESNAPTDTTNRVCATTTTCDTREFEAAAPTGTTDRVCEPESLVLARPFFTGDAALLRSSFERWTEYPPCALDESGAPSGNALPVKLILYFARDPTDAAEGEMRDLINPILDNTLYPDANWRKCFQSIAMVGGYLTAEEDQYHSRQDEPSWNLGPNMQFWRFVQHVTDSADASTFYYMEGDNVPLSTNWLDALAAEIAAQRPFSVLGGRYSGHNWNGFGADIIKPALQNHLNGNGVYDVNHPLIIRGLADFDDSSGSTWATVLHSSFDVYFCELLMEVDGVAASDLGNAGHDYKQSPLLTNFATTLTLPQDIPADAEIVHGAVYAFFFGSVDHIRF
jgi:hypothetical protein